jgi:putative FmdB family regulatory protein
MPTYEYECKSCGHTFETFQAMSDDPLRNCPECGKEVRRLINGGSGVIFRGSGFYVTDKGKSAAGKSAGDKKDSAASSAGADKSPAASSTGVSAGGETGGNSGSGGSAGDKGSGGNSGSGGNAGDKGSGGTSAEKARTSA